MKKVLLIMLLISGVAVGASTGYHKSNEIKIGGAGSWDYLSVDVAVRRAIRFWLAGETGQVEALDHDSELPEHRRRAPGRAPRRRRRGVLVVGAL